MKYIVKRIGCCLLLRQVDRAGSLAPKNTPHFHDVLRLHRSQRDDEIGQTPRQHWCFASYGINAWPCSSHAIAQHTPLAILPFFQCPTFTRLKIILHNEDDIAKMRVAGRLASEVLDFITPHVKPGVTTGAINKLCHDYIVNVQKTIPAPLNYAPPGHRPFPASVCTSVNHQVCHGIPGDKALKNGDVLNIDVTIIKDGYHGDTSRMFFIGEASIQAKRLCEVTYEAMWRGISKVKPGATLGDIGYAIQSFTERAGYSVVREFCGHGIGKQFHTEPQVMHYGRPGAGLALQAGMIFTIEPMINAGKKDIRVLGDGWTVVTADHSLSAQWEHTVLTTESGFEVLTVSAGTPAPPALH